MTDVSNPNENIAKRAPWNEGKIVGAKRHSAPSTQSCASCARGLVWVKSQPRWRPETSGPSRSAGRVVAEPNFAVGQEAICTSCRSQLLD